MKGMNMLSSITKRFTEWKAQREDKRRAKELRRTAAEAQARWEKASPAEKDKARKAAAKMVGEMLHKMHREQLMESARQHFLQNDRVQALKGGVMWWPALAPLTRSERDNVRYDLGLQTRPRKEARP